MDLVTLAKLVIQGGCLVLLFLVLAGIFVLARTLLPQGIAAIVALTRELASFGQKLDHFDRRLGQVIEGQTATGAALDQVAEVVDEVAHNVHHVRQQTDPNIQIPIPLTRRGAPPSSSRAVR